MTSRLSPSPKNAQWGLAWDEGETLLSPVPLSASPGDPPIEIEPIVVEIVRNDEAEPRKPVASEQASSTSEESIKEDPDPDDEVSRSSSVAAPEDEDEPMDTDLSTTSGSPRLEEKPRKPKMETKMTPSSEVSTDNKVGPIPATEPPSTQQPAEDSSEQSSKPLTPPLPRQPRPGFTRSPSSPVKTDHARDLRTRPSTKRPDYLLRLSSSMGAIDVATLRLCIGGLTTGASCARVETFMRQQPGIFRAHVTLLTGRGIFEYDPHSVTPQAIENLVASLGFQPIPVPSDALVSVVLHIGAERPARARMFLMAIDGVASVLDADGTFPGGQPSSALGAGSCTGKSLLVEYDPQVIGARTLVRRLSAALGYQVQAFSLPPPGPLQDLQGMKSLGKLVLWCTLLILPIAFVKYLAPLFKLDLQQLAQATIVTGLRNLDAITLCCATPILLFVAYPINKNGMLALRLEKRVTMDMLVSLSAFSCFLYGLGGLVLGIFQIVEVSRCSYFLEAVCWLILLVLMSRFICALLTPRISSSIDGLAQTQAKTAILMEKQRDGRVKESYIDVLLVERGDTLKVLSGARVPTDGVVLEGVSAVDESMVTGELAKVQKDVDSVVIGGTINAHGVLVMKATRTINESILCRTAALVREAQASKCATQRVARGLSTCLALFMIIVAILTLVAWYEGAIHAWASTHGWEPFPFALRLAVATLVVSCPSAFNLVVPTAVTIAITTAARFGLLFKGGSALEALDRADVVVFNKTGTLTTGKLEVVDFLIASTRKPGMSARKLWCYLASAEQKSEHAIARAILSYARKVHTPLTDARKFESIAGCGVQCRVDGHPVFVGSLKWMLDVLRVDVPLDLAARNELFQREGCVVVCLAVDHLLCALVALQDPPRPEAALVLDRVRNRKRQAWLVTGDQRETALAVAESLGIPECCVIADALPHQKANKIRVLEGIGKRVAFVGDGVTDVAALEVAHVGVALGANSDAIVGSADVVLLKDDLRDLANAFDLAARTTRSFRFGLGWVSVGVLALFLLSNGVLYPALGFSISPAVAGLAELVLCAPVLVATRMLSRWIPTLRNPPDDPLRSTEGSFVVLDINNKDATELTSLLPNKRPA